MGQNITKCKNASEREFGLEAVSAPSFKQRAVAEKTDGPFGRR
jgi:hypothetical protein